MVTCLFCPILHALSRAWDTRETQEVHQEGEGLAGHMHTRKGWGLEVTCTLERGGVWRSHAHQEGERLGSQEGEGLGGHMV